MFAVLAFAVLYAPAWAGVSRSDVTAMRAYLRASDVSARAVSGEVAARIAAIDARESEVAERCPSALSYAPRDSAFEEMGEELSVAQWYAGAAPLRSIMLQLSAAIGHLSWSDRRLTQLVRAQAAEERADAAIVLPDVCGQIAAWKASAYTTLPASVSAFRVHIESIEAGYRVGPSEERREALILHLLRRYEGAGERRLARRIEGLEESAIHQAVVGAEAARNELAAAMGVSEL